MRDSCEINHAEICHLKLEMLSNYQVQRTKIVIYQFKILRKLFCQVDSLIKQVEQLFVFLLHTFCVVSSGRLVVLGYEIFKSHLSIEHTAILSLLHNNIIHELFGSIFLGCLNLEYFLFDSKLVVEPLFLKILLELGFEDQVENSFLCLSFGYFKDILCCFLELVGPSNGVNHLKNVSIQRIIQMLNTLYLKRISLYPTFNLDLRCIEFRRMCISIFKYGRILVNKSHNLFQISDSKNLFAFRTINESLLVAQVLQILLINELIQVSVKI